MSLMRIGKEITKSLKEKATLSGIYLLERVFFLIRGCGLLLIKSIKVEKERRCGGIIMRRLRRFFRTLFKKVADMLEETIPQATPVEEEIIVIAKLPPHKIKEARVKVTKKGKNPVVPYVEIPGRDLMDMMEVPFLALSKNRKSPILYESKDGTRKVKVSRHTGHYLASIYDWDIVLFVASKMQRIINEMSDIPPRTMVVPRHELLKAIHRTNGKKTDKDLESSLSRLQLTGIETTIRNEDYKYKAGFGFLDSWGYTKRKDVKEISITLSQWLYDGICAKGSLLKVEPSYFALTSGLKRFLYRTARKHAGENKKGWWFTIEDLYKKSGSEGSLKLFKSRLKKIVLESKIPDYYMEWIEENGKDKVLFKKYNFQDNIQELDRLAEECTKKQQNNNDFNKLNESNQ